MLAAYARSQYQEMEVQTTPGRLVVMLYEGAVRFLQGAHDAMLRNDMPARCYNLGRAQNILGHLMSTLDMRAGKISEDLFAIYRYCVERLLQANVEDRADHIMEVIELLSSLKISWEQAERTVRSEERSLVGAAGSRC